MTTPDMSEFQRIKRLPPYVFGIVNELKAAARARGEDIVDFGMGNPDQPTPQHIVDKLAEAELVKQDAAEAADTSSDAEAVAQASRTRRSMWVMMPITRPDEEWMMGPPLLPWKAGLSISMRSIPWATRLQSLSVL